MVRGRPLRRDPGQGPRTRGRWRSDDRASSRRPRSRCYDDCWQCAVCTQAHWRYTALKKSAFSASQTLAMSCGNFSVHVHHGQLHECCPTKQNLSSGSVHSRLALPASTRSTAWWRALCSGDGSRAAYPLRVSRRTTLEADLAEAGWSKQLCAAGWDPKASPPRTQPQPCKARLPLRDRAAVSKARRLQAMPTPE